MQFSNKKEIFCKKQKNREGGQKQSILLSAPAGQDLQDLRQGGLAKKAVSLSSFCVVTNALRLNLFSVHGKANKDAAPAAEPVEIKTSESEEKVMTKTMHIEGMMCGHCEATVKKALEALPEVTSAEVSHEAGTAVVTLSSEVADDVLKKTVEEKDYKVTAID